jgi:hypothetical protein
VIAAQEDGEGIGRIRMLRVPDASAGSLMPFIDPAVEPGSTVHSSDWTGYDPLKGMGYRHRITFLKGQKESASELLPRVHLVVSLLKRWLLGRHQGAVAGSTWTITWMSLRFVSIDETGVAVESSSCDWPSRP